MKDHASQPGWIDPKAKAYRFLQGSTKHFADGAYMFSRALVWYWFHFRTESTRKGVLLATTALCLLGTQRRTKTEACDSPLVGEMGTSNVKLRGGRDSDRPA